MNDFKCFIGLHHYEVMAEKELTDVRGNKIGITVVSRCTNCGKIKSIDVVTTVMY